MNEGMHGLLQNFTMHLFPATQILFCFSSYMGDNVINRIITNYSAKLLDTFEFLTIVHKKHVKCI